MQTLLKKIEASAAARLVLEPGRQPSQEIAREVELLAGIQTGREQARRREGIPAEDARKLVDSWASR